MARQGRAARRLRGRARRCRSRKRSSKRRTKRAFPTAPISTVRIPRASASISSRRSGRGAHLSAMSYLKPALGRPNLSVTLAQSVLACRRREGPGHWHRSFRRRRRGADPRRARGRSSPRARSDRRSCFCNPASARPHISKKSASGRSTICRASAAICRIISISASSANAPAITPTTNMASRIGRRSPALRYALFRDGPAASSLFETGGFWFADRNAQSPDIQFHLGMGSGIEAGIAKLDNAGVTLNTAFMRPRSRGTVRLAGSDPRAAPLIDPNYWDDPYDRQMSIAGLKTGARNHAAECA